MNTLSITDTDLTKFWQINNKITSTEELIYHLCNSFLGTPYQLLADPIVATASLKQLLISLTNDNEFTYTLDSFDCVTFVETVLALTFAKYCRNVNAFYKVFQTNLLSLRYLQGISTFFRRNYFFICIDWIPKNKWCFLDVTKQINNTPAHAKTYIDKVSWLYNYKLLDPYKGQITVADLNTMLVKLNIHFVGKESIIPYIPIGDLLLNYNKYITLFPNISVVCIIRPDWDVTDKYANYGTHLNISHLGICLKRENELYFYHANSIDDRIVQVIKLTDYLTKYINSPTIKGINVLRVKV